MENLETLTSEQLVEKIRELEVKNKKLETDILLANYKLSKMDYMEKALKAIGVAVEFLNYKCKE